MFNLIAMTVFVVPLAAWRGYVLSVLWAWFVVPAFGLPPLSITQALGIAVLVAMLTHQTETPKKEEDQVDASLSTIYMIIAGLINPLFALAVGWVVMRLT